MILLHARTHHRLDSTAAQYFTAKENHRGDSMPRSCVLKVEGKAVTVQTFHDGAKMCAIDYQASRERDYMVHICERNIEKGRQIALHFPRKNSYYCIKVVGKTLTVEQTASVKSPDQIPNEYWFVMKNIGGGEKYSLSSCVAPSVWLSLCTDPPYSFILSEHPQEVVQVSDELI